MNISGFGVRVQIIASNTFPAGITITQLADDADPIDSGSQQLADKAMGLNGDQVNWSKAVPIPVTLNVIPGTEDDQNLQVLANANRVAKGKNGARDVITMTIVYPDGTVTTLTEGALTDAVLVKSIASAGRLKTMPYIFAFENKVEA